MAGILEDLMGILASKSPEEAKGILQRLMTVQPALGMDPNTKRLSLLPRYSQQEGWVAPEIVHSAAKAFTAPAEALQGADFTPADAMNVAGILQAGSLPALASRPQAGVLGATAYHGSPHKWAPEPGFPFGRFKPEAVGTGQGAAAYGHAPGGYWAENKAVASSPEYMGPEAGYKRLSGHLSPIEEFAHDMVTSGRKPDDVWNAMVQKYGRQSAETKGFQDAYDSAIAAKGNLYKADIPDEAVAKMLDWDLPLSKQHHDVQKSLGKLAASGDPILSELFSNGAPVEALGVFDKSMGGQIYNTLAAQHGGPPALSAKLRELGIPGIKYLDQGSRMIGSVNKFGDNWFFKGSSTPYPTQEAAQAAAEKAGNVTRNFVVFDPALPKVIGRE